MRPLQHHIQSMFAEVSLGSPDHAIGFVLWRLVARYQREADRALAPLNLTSLQFTTLAMVAWLTRETEAVTQVELSRAAGIHPMQVSQTLKTLETKAMISRRRDPSDTRANRLALTPAGLHALRGALPRMVEVQANLFGSPGLPGGSLLRRLLELDSRLPPETSSA